MRLVIHVASVACASMLAAACVERTPVAPVSAITASRTQLLERSHPNSQKYRDRGFHPATGSAGIATVSTRALLDKFGTTDVEVTTGTFDGPAGPGTLSKVQIKAFTPSGKLGFTNNYNGLSASSAHFPYTRLPHGAGVQVQTLVQNGTRTDVVTLNDVVHFRPDLIASRLDAPAQAPLGAAVNLQGFISEANGEVGARADCVLYVDGAAVDRASGIWVDAAGIVACAMTHVFTEARNYALELRVENVRPGDFDDANDRISASISIVAPVGLDFFGLAAQSYQVDSWWRSVSTLLTAEGIEETWDQTYRLSGVQQGASAAAIIKRVLPTPITLRGEMSTNGAGVCAIEHSYATLDWVDWMGAFFGTQYDFATGTATYVTVYPDGGNPGFTWVQYDCSGADVRYHTESYVTFWDPSGELNARWIYEDYSDTRPMVTYGPDFSASLSIQGAEDGAPVAGQLTVQLEPVELQFDFSSGDCSTLGNLGCLELHSHSVGVLGYDSYGSWPEPAVP